MSLTRVDVATPSRQYPILIGRGLLAERAHYPAELDPARCVIVSNETIAPLYLERVQQAFGGGLREYLMPDGERYKSLDTCAALLDYLLEQRLGRDCTLLALGGGVVGDLTGFAAAIFQRGIHFVQLPTTLLAQVDSSVGGKTAVNRPLGKNMVGAFHQPIAVLADTDTLGTLPQREFLAGLAEVLKYGLLGDADFYHWIRREQAGLLARDPALLQQAIEQSCRHKAAIVAADEREAGQRALLNLGHTFGHAIEAHLQYRDWLHGEAVACGMLMAAAMSARLGWLHGDEVARLRELLHSLGLPVAPPAGLTPAAMLEHMRGDKKNLGGQIRLVLLDKIGQARVVSDYAAQALEDTLHEFCHAQG